MRSHMRLVLLILSAAGLLTTLILPATAGAYYRNGYVARGYYSDHASVWYSSSCCYRKVVRHARSVRYVRIHRHRAYYYGGYGRYYGDGYGRHYGGSHYARPYRARSYYQRPYAVRNVGYYGSVSTGCYSVRVRVDDRRGGWVWGWERVCN